MASQKLRFLRKLGFNFVEAALSDGLQPFLERLIVMTLPIPTPQTPHALYRAMFFYIVAGGLIALWLYNAYNAGSLAGDIDYESGKRSFAFGTFVLYLVFNSLWTFAQIGLVRLFIELVINSGKKN